MLEFDRIRVSYGKEEVLRELSLSCHDAMITTIVGKNGCGKSTLLRSAVGLVPPSAGAILLDGLELSHQTGTERAKRIAYLSQGKNVPDITVERMVLHGRFPYLSYPRRYRREDYEYATDAMRQMGILDLAQKPLRVLSGGTRQKVYLAMALCQQAHVILLDEPTTYLDVGQQLRLCDTLRTLAANGKTVVTVLHDLPVALKISHRIAVMDQGRIVAFGSPQEIVDSSILGQVLGVTLRSVSTDCGVEYYYDRSEV